MAEQGTLARPGRAAGHRKKAKAGRIAYLIHSATGLWLTLVLSVVMISGTLTVLDGEIDWLLYPQSRVAPGDERINPGDLFDAAVAAYPGYGVSSIDSGSDFHRKSAPAFAAAPDGSFRLIWMDQYTGEALGTTGAITVGRFLNLLHTSLFLPLVGRAVVNFFGVLALVSLITGLISYKRFWRGFLKRPRFSRNARTWLGDLHRLTALWSVWFLLIIGITGTWWFYETPLVTMAGAPPLTAERHHPHLTTEELNALGPETPKRLPTGKIVDAAREAYPDFVTRVIVAPETAADPFMLIGRRGEALAYTGLNRIYVNPYTGVVMGADLYEEVRAIGRVDEAMKPLHYGTWGERGTPDIVVKLIWFAGGAALSFLCVSGLVIYWKRTGDALAGAAPGGWRRARRAWNLVKPWGGAMGGLKYPNLIALGLMGYGGYLLLALVAQGVQDKGFLYTEQPVGPFDIQLTALAGVLETGLPPIREGARTTILPKLADGRFEDARFIWANVGGETPPAEPGALAEGPVGLAQARLRLPGTLDGTERLWLTVETWDGARHRQSWPLFPDGKSVFNLEGRSRAAADDPA